MDSRRFASGRPTYHSHRRAALSIGRLAAVLAVALAALLGTVGVQFYTDFLWYQSLGFASVYLTMLGTQGVLFAAAAGLFFGLFALNVLVARRMAYAHQSLAGGEDDGIWAYVARVGARMAEPAVSVKSVNRGILLLGALLALLMGLIASGQWDTVLRFLNDTPFGRTEPLFHQEISFYVFTLPFLRFAHSWLIGAWILVGTACIAVYAVVLVYELGVSLERATAQLQLGAKLHLATLAAGLMLLMAANHVLDLFELVYSTRSVAFGAGYTDANAQAPALLAMTASAVLAATLMLASAFARGFRLAVAGLALWAVVAIVGGIAYPSFVQNFQVRPNELERERPYIANSIRMTLQAYGLDSVEERFFPAEDEVTPEEIQANAATIQNIRLWDHRPLRDTLNQIQSIRSYYGFHDVDVDRYEIDGRLRQVMVSARELIPEQLQTQARSWVNRHLQFTHGYGIAMSLVSTAAQEGRPELVVQDVPPQGKLRVDRPEIYFGERTTTYIVVDTTTPEFDYPVGDENATTTYQASTGVNIGSPLNRLAFALRFGDPNLLLSNAFTGESRIHFRRQIVERVQQLAPFLLLDPDPYIVLADGQLFWLQDAYTFSNAFPYSTPREFAPGGPWLNYIRNSVKVTVNAYDGTVRFYVADPTDPVIQTYQRIFPDLFQPLSAMPSALRSHLRYPERLFTIQADVFNTYHMQDPTVFYNLEDVWTVPFEKVYGERRPIEPYYVIMRLPGEEEPEFLLMEPFTPRNKDNMIAWLAGRIDGSNYGKLLLFKYPKDKLVYGPLQVEGFIDQDPTISAQLTLWSQSGSQVIRGNMLVIPIGTSNLYVEPLYLQAQNGPIPELKRVIVATGNRVVMEPTLEQAIARLFNLPAPGQTPGDGTPRATAPPTTSAPTAPPGLDATITRLARSAQEHYARAQTALREGNWAAYGEALKAMEADLQRLVELTGAAHP